MSNPNTVIADTGTLYASAIATQGNILIASNTSLAGVSPPGVSQFIPVPVVHKQIATPSTGFSITILNSTSPSIYLGLTPAGTLATGTITLPSAPFVSQEVVICSTHIVTALTLNAAAGQTLIPSITALAVNTPVRLIWDASASSWYPY